MTPNVLVADKQADLMPLDQDEDDHSNEPLKKEKRTGPDEQLLRGIEILKNGAKPAPATAASAAAGSAVQ